MTENPNEWPRCHTCIYNWCPEKSDRCKGCDTIIRMIRQWRRRDDEAIENPRPIEPMRDEDLATS
jgi:hypothetical protein